MYTEWIKTIKLCELFKNSPNASCFLISSSILIILVLNTDLLLAFLVSLQFSSGKLTMSWQSSCSSWVFNSSFYSLSSDFYFGRDRFSASQFVRNLIAIFQVSTKYANLITNTYCNSANINEKWNLDGLSHLCQWTIFHKKNLIADVNISLIESLWLIRRYELYI